MKILLAILIISIIGTAIVTFFETIFGVANVFYFCLIVTFIAGTVIVPIMQIRNKK